MAHSLYSLDAPRSLSRRTRSWTAIGLVSSGTLIAVTAANGATQMREMPSVALAHSLVGFFVAGVIALLMLGHAHASRRRGYLMVGGTFIYTTLLMAVLPLFFVGAVIPDQRLLGTAESACNLIYAWYFVLPICVAVSALMVFNDQRTHSRPSLTSKRIVAGIVLSILGAAVTIVVATSNLLPAILTVDGQPTPYAEELNRWLLVLSLIGVAVAMWCASNGSIIGRWLAAFNVLMLGLAVVRLSAPASYTLSWYANRILWVLAASGLLAWLILSLVRVDRHNTQMAVVDSLTGSESRLSLLDAMQRELARIRSTGRQLALLWLDLDGFKGINDQHGHQVGDEVLRGVVDRLAAQIRPGDHVGRLGGDEFGVFLCDDVELTRVVAVADSLLASIRAPMRIGDGLIHVTGTVGIATAPADATRAEDLLLCADLAMYAAKNRGGDRSERFNERIGTEAVAKARLRHELADSLRNNEFCLYYQPIYEADGLRMAGVEVLVRWLRNGVVVPAGQFVPFAEQSGQIVILGRIVVAQLSRELPRLLAINDDDFFVSVNLSVKELADPPLIEELLRGSFLDRPGQVVVEVTESLELQETSEAEVNLERLRMAGMRIAIDDFGAGFSNLSRLEQLRPSLLKVDRSLVRRAGSETEGGVAFLTAATSVAASLDCDVIAEGVETQAEAQVVELLGVRYVQGFRYSEPVPIEALVAPSSTRSARGV